MWITENLTTATTKFNSKMDSDPPSQGPTNMEAPRQKRNRRVNTCLECRRLKRKCSRTYPCGHCQLTSRECVFPTTAAGTTTTPFAEPKAATHPNAFPYAFHEASSPVPGSGGRSISHRATNEHLGNALDMCLRIGRLSITERIGGMPRLSILQAIDKVLHTSGAMELGLTDDRFSAPISAWFKPHATLPLGLLLSPTGIDRPGASDEVALNGTQQAALVERYFVAVHPLAPFVTRTDLQVDDNSTKALRLAVYYAAAVSMPIIGSQDLFGMPKPMLVTKLNTATTMALSQARVVSRMDLRLFQALLTFLTPQFLGEISQSHAIYISGVIRHFQIAGYDWDDETDPPGTRQTKRHLWQHLLFMSQRGTEAVGPERTIVDDIEATIPSVDWPEPEDDERDGILAVVRYECYRIHRWIFRERPRIRKGLIPIDTFLEMLSQNMVLVQNRYLAHLDITDTFQKYASLVGKLLLARAEGMILHGPHHGVEQTIAMELRQRAIRTDLEILETSMVLETDPDFAHWLWYTSAYHQYHSVLFPLSQMCLEPSLPEADRIVVVMEHVFGPSSPTSTPQQRGLSILLALRENISSFLSIRGIPAITGMNRMDDIPFEQTINSMATNPYSILNYQPMDGDFGFMMAVGDSEDASFVPTTTAPLDIESDVASVWWQLSPQFLNVLDRTDDHLTMGQP
jgi:hypothetical protein